MNAKKMAEEILQNIGGKNNIQNIVHCSTRLRINLKDDTLVQKSKVEKIDGVLSVVESGGQFQIVIGNEVSKVYNEIVDTIGTPAADGQTQEKKKWSFSRILDAIAGIFSPAIPCLAGAGMLKALLVLFVTLGLLDKSSQNYIILNMIGDAGFYFLPMLLAVSCAEKFKTSKYLALLIGGVLLHPTFTQMVADGSPVHFFGLPVTLATYSSSVIPIILTVWIMSYIEKLAEKISPSAIKVFLKPLLTIIITAPIALIVVGPLGMVCGDYLSKAIYFMQDHLQWAAVMVLSCIYPFVVMTGMHKMFIPMIVQSFVDPGYELLIIPVTLCSNFAQAAASFAVSLKSKDKKMKQLGLSSSITALFAGVTEPALYGVTLKLKRPMIACMIGSAAAGLYAGITQLRSFAYAVPSVFAFPQWIDENASANLINALITAAISLVVTFIATMVLGFKEDVEDNSEEVVADDKITDDKNEEVSKEKSMQISVNSPVNGKFANLSDVNDEIFSKEVMGKGFAVIPEEGKVFAPFDGEILAFMDTKHAIGLKSDDGVELLIHVGLDTVELKGKYFEACAKAGDKVKKGQLLLKFDIEEIKNAGYDTITPVIVGNTDDYLEIICDTSKEKITNNDTILYAVNK